MRNNVLYQGKAWHRTTFELAKNPAERVFLRFGGVAIRAKVWVNKQLVGQHLFPYTGFELDITDAAQNGTNTLVVLADNELLDEAIPDKKCTGWWNYGGINRAVQLETRPAVYTEDVTVTTRQAGGAWAVDLAMVTRNFGGAANGKLTAAIQDARGRTVWSGEASKTFSPGATETRLSAALKAGQPWSPETPVLYTLKVTTGAHVKTVRFGLREIAVRGTQIVLNGKPVFLRGVNYHEMYPGAGMTLSRDQVRRDLLDMKALGCNMVRLAHYTHDHQAYELADELGLLVWSEIPAWQTRADVLASDAVWEAYGAPQLREMVEQYRNHSSVVIWSVGNEFPSEQAGVARYVARGCDLVRKLDPTRLVTFASDRRERDVSFDAVDFIAVNEYFGWYYGNVHDLGPNLDLLHKKWPGKPIVVSEFGSDSIYGWKNPTPPDAGMDYSEDYQVKLLTTHLRDIYDDRRAAFMSGRDRVGVRGFS